MPLISAETAGFLRTVGQPVRRRPPAGAFTVVTLHYMEIPHVQDVFYCHTVQSFQDLLPARRDVV
jgi:hypothetical protein